jgi:predicted N-acyltransferase
MYCTTTDALRDALRSAGQWRLSSSADRIDFSLYHSLGEVPRGEWETVVRGQSLYMQWPYLTALEGTSNADISLHFALFRRKGEVCGAAVFQLTGFEAPDIRQNMAEEKPLLQWITRRMTSGTQRQCILICGNAFATGEHGYSFHPELNAKKAMDALCYCITALLKVLKEDGRKVVAVLVKDFYPGRFEHAYALGKCGFREFNVDRNMVMPLDAAWRTLDDYLADLVTKFRTKAHAALERSRELQVKRLDAAAIHSQSEQIDVLFRYVHEKADFRLGSLNAETFAALEKTMGNDFRMYGYFLGDKMIGFRTTLLGADCLDAHMVGIDYTYNKEYALYSRMLYDYISEGIEARVCRIVFGRTAGEIKTTVGALPVDLKCCIRHPGKVSNLLLGLLFRYVQPSPFPIRQPYKKEVAERQKHALGEMCSAPTPM